jgi:hypothetical protein
MVAAAALAGDAVAGGELAAAAAAAGGMDVVVLGGAIGDDAAADVGADAIAGPDTGVTVAVAVNGVAGARTVGAGVAVSGVVIEEAVIAIVEVRCGSGVRGSSVGSGVIGLSVFLDRLARRGRYNQSMHTQRRPRAPGASKRTWE